MTLAGLLRQGALSDEFARLRRDLATLPSQPRHLVILGAAGGEGVTTVAAHLALALSGVRGSEDLLLIDGNLRAPTLERELGLAPGAGLLDWDLVSPLPVRRVDGFAGLQVLGAGTIGRPMVGGPSIEERLATAAQRVRSDFTASVWDSPPVLRYNDGLDLAAAADGAIVVIEMDRTRVGGLGYLRAALERRKATLLGSVLNRSGRYWPRAPRQAPV